MGDGSRGSEATGAGLETRRSRRVPPVGAGVGATGRNAPVHVLIKMENGSIRHSMSDETLVALLTSGGLLLVAERESAARYE